jgi:adenosylmethionine-8-amino-7-oxononanoate aminotransferase
MRDVVAEPAGAARPSRGGTQDVFYPPQEMPHMVRGEGVYLWDRDGTRYLDVASGAFLANLGQGNERVISAMTEQARSLSYSCVRTTTHDANAALADRLTELAGPGFERVHVSSGGSEAVEVALKLLRRHALATGRPERTRVITLMPSYHGATLATLGMNGDQTVPEAFGPMAVLSEKVPAPLTCRAPSPQAAAAASAAALEETIERLGPQTVLAFVMEPVGGQSSGANVPHADFIAQARRICTRFGINLVFDEVVSAFRTGRVLAAHHHPDALPDLVVLAKGLGAGYAALGAVLAHAAFVDELAAGGGLGSLHSSDASPIACAAGRAVLDEVVERDLLGNAERIGARLRAGLESIAASSPLVGDVRGAGLLLGIELVRDRATMERFDTETDPADRLRRHGARHGLLMYARRQNAGVFGDWLLVAPPLILTEPECDELVDRLAAAVDDAARELLG